MTSDNPRVLLGNRIAASLLGSYVFCWGLISLGVAGLYAAGLDYHDAEAVSMMIGLIAFLVAFLGSFAASRISQVWGILLGSGVVMILTARFIQNSLVSGS
ncbi:MAG: iron uptake protein [Gammaproteobacteria bacterium]|nr:iron uptake protein [Gammaproteobacteria bacterium]